MTDFERVWQQILEVARTIGEITTLTHKVSNQVVSVAEEAIVVKSKRTEQPRQLAKSMFRRVYDALTIHRQIMCKRDEDVLVSHQRIIMAFLAHLPNVEYSIRPQTLYLMPANTHPLGTMREHIEGKQRVDAHKGHLSCRELKEAFKKAVRKYGEDENVLHYLGKRIRGRHYLTPQDFFYIVCWKAPRGNASRGKAANHAFECIRRSGAKGIEVVTKEAIGLAEKDEIEKSVEKLAELHGVSTLFKESENV